MSYPRIAIGKILFGQRTLARCERGAFENM
jgi:hypothetical protein